MQDEYIGKTVTVFLVTKHNDKSIVYEGKVIDIGPIFITIHDRVKNKPVLLPLYNVAEIITK